MAPEPDCSRVPLGVGPCPGTGTDERDLLRLEPFGAVFYRHRDCSTRLLEPGLTRLLTAARERSILDVYAADPEALPHSDQAFAESVVRWRDAGYIGADFRCRARLIDARGAGTRLSAPLVCSLQLTAACNLRCDHCYVETMAKPSPAQITTGEIEAALAELDVAGTPILVLAGGEPMAREGFFDLVESLRRYRLDAFLCTNGTLISERNAARLASSPLRGISVSLDGPDAETHDAQRGAGRFDQTVGAIHALVAAGAPEVAIRTTVTPRNVDRLSRFADLAGELGIHKVVLKPFSRVGDASGAAALVIERERYFAAIDRLLALWPEDICRLETGDGMPTRPPEWSEIIPPFGCVGGNTTVTITYDARVVACSCEVSATDWSLREHSLMDCWRESPTLRRWRRLNANETCRACDQLATCGGGCRARSLGVDGGIDGVDPWAPCAQRT